MISYNSNIVTDGLKIHVDAGNKRSYPGTGTVWYNIAPNATLNGTRVGAVTWNANEGQGSMYFSGVTSAGQYYLFGAGTNYIISNTFTFESWFKSSGMGVGQTEGGLWSGTYLLRFFTTPGSAVQMISYNSSTSASNNGPVSTGFNSAENKWHHVVATNDGVSGFLYIDGKLNNTAIANCYEFSRYITSNFAIGIDINNTMLNFNGYIAIGRYYNRNLSYKEVTQNFNAQRGRFGL